MSPTARATVEPMAFPTDARGLVIEPLHPDEIPGQRNAHLVLTVPGAIRGNHYHRRGTEVALVLGPALVRFRDADGLRDCEVAAGRAVRYVFPPGVPHAMLNTGDAPMVILSFNTEPHDPERPDVVREILIETPG
jgi:UDP-2-acetamido-2,6-beta-L-arabino-hexul-4-ose reductase